LEVYTSLSNQVTNGMAHEFPSAVDILPDIQDIPYCISSHYDVQLAEIMSYLKLGSAVYESQMCVRAVRRWLLSPPT
jgi:hypothetical protein